MAKPKALDPNVDVDTFTDASGEWVVKFHWEDIDGVAQVTGLEIWGGPPPEDDATADRRPVTTSVLRSMPLRRLVDHFRAQRAQDIESLLADGEFFDTPAKVAKATGQLAVLAKRPPGRPPTHGPGHLEHVAAVYNAALQSADSHHALTRAVSEAFGANYSTVGKWLRQCRAAGLLPPSVHGRPATKKAAAKARTTKTPAKKSTKTTTTKTKGKR